MFFLSLDVFAAGSDDDNTIAKPRAYKNAVKLIKKEDYSKAIIILEKILDKKKYQKDPDILNEYAFALRKNGKLAKAEAFYNKALDIDPKHNGALEYLGELYVDTKRKDKAILLLSKLRNCQCEEYSELKNYIANN
tara:strand:- start:2619 stop:3026 length:408 start_codon:yes stop_codon:yes gene_type:complete